MADHSIEEIQKALDLLESQKATNQPTKTKVEFSKKWLVGCALFTIGFVAMSYVLSFFDKNPLESLASTIITTMCTVDATSFTGYIVQNCVRAYSENKFCAGDHKTANNENKGG